MDNVCPIRIDFDGQKTEEKKLVLSAKTYLEINQRTSEARRPAPTTQITFNKANFCSRLMGSLEELRVFFFFGSFLAMIVPEGSKERSQNQFLSQFYFFKKS